MVLELKVPPGATFAHLAGLVPIFPSCVLSFVFVAIYWNDHHHLLHACRRVNGILWANMHLLFWLSLIPFTAGLMRESDLAELSVAFYGFSMSMPAVAYFVLQSRNVRANGTDHSLAEALGRDVKGKISVVICVAGIALALVNHWLGCGAYVVLALLWLAPDRRIERAIAGN
jgi:uncharacterized membrane protein